MQAILKSLLMLNNMINTPDEQNNEGSWQREVLDEVIENEKAAIRAAAE